MRDGKKLAVLGVSGSIAAYKAADLCSKLAKDFAVQVVMTAAAEEFVTALTFQTLSRYPVITSLWNRGDWKPGHVALADEADLLAVVPATADILAKMASGIADDALSTFAATFDGPVLVAPAMNPRMWQHPACRQNCELLRRRGVFFAGPASGPVACGDVGTGRLTEVAEILDRCRQLLA